MRQKKMKIKINSHLPFSFFNIYNRRISNYIFISFFSIWIFFYLTFTNYIEIQQSHSRINWTSGEGEGSPNVSLPFPPASMTQRHNCNWCREVISAYSYWSHSNWQCCNFEPKSLNSKLHARKEQFSRIIFINAEDLHIHDRNDNKTGQ